jgi:trans-2,3-dihydro-3-hydroxyanthranilate isomerase
MALKFLQYDVFTDRAFSGNQLAVFLDGRGLAVDAMQAIAKEMNFSESTFILPSEEPGTDVRMRIFTPNSELPMAGHPTIGSTFALAHAGVITAAAPRFTFGLGVGPTPVDLRWDQGRLAFAAMRQLNPKFGAAIADPAGALASIGLTDDDIVKELPVQQVTCGVPYVIIPLRDRVTVDRATPDLASFRKFAARHHLPLDMGIYLFALSPHGDEAYARMFAPGLGIPEDPATGSAAGPLGCYVVRHRHLCGDYALTIDQGVKMGRPSKMHVSIAEQAGEVVRVQVGGQAVLVGQGELLLEHA